MSYLLDTNVAIARAHNLILVTHNTDEFSQVQG
jgi:predicted nucleic acid-binding protein